jgi:phage terminase large subunit-like protein
MALMALRLGDDPRLLLTTTPRAIPALKELVAAPDVAVTRSPTEENAANLAAGFVEYLQGRYAATRLGRQELGGELIEDNEQALWKRAWIEAGRLRRAPFLRRLVVAVDPPAGLKGDECGIIVAGRDEEGHGHVVADRSAAGLSPAAWAARAAQAYEDFQADVLVAEANQGGEMVRAVLAQAGAHLPVTLVHATRNKMVRAAPAAALYEQGRVHHIGAFPELEDQMCQYDGSSAHSPDRMDALVWALAALFEKGAGEPRVRPV